MADTVNIDGKDAVFVHKRRGTYWADEYPRWPTGLDPQPESYNIYLPKEKLHPITDLMPKADPPVEPVDPPAPTDPVDPVVDPEPPADVTTSVPEEGLIHGE